MNLLKMPPSPIRLAELALANGWPAQDVASDFVTMTGAGNQAAPPSISSPKVDAGSNVVRDEFARRNAKRR